eukprot:TRINITY_DN22431_c0_g1_i1.p1 TRINITY_DN22431_c0_g1~~TRINITY_DN22431_c0_g1_i1.p1  ORF type:complete len:128 (+),score=19.76 TRINITY_DN22431_c0_g1_i1:58-441(+)
MSQQASADLCWRIIKGNNAFLKKQRYGRGRERTVLTTESLNLTARSSFKHSGIVHSKAVGLQLGAKGVELTVAGKEATITPVKRALRTGAKVARLGRKDLRVACKARAQRLKRLTTRKTRKTWKKEE